MRARVHFAKTDLMKYTGHLDLFRTWERTIRRAALPLAYTQGFRPHPRLNLAAALPLGFTSDCELIDIWLEQDMELEDVKSALTNAAPPGLEILDIKSVELQAPSLQSIVESSEYSITLAEPMPDISQRIAALVSSRTLPRIWRGKDYDLRALIHYIEFAGDDEHGRHRIITQLSAKEGATGRPEEVILALGAEPKTSQVHRTRLVFSQEPLIEPAAS
jgi:radical SAM-linked protein